MAPDFESRIEKDGQHLLVVGEHRRGELVVSLTAWLSGNPFNGTVFAILAAVLVAIAAGFPNAAVRLRSFAWVAPGASAGRPKL